MTVKDLIDELSKFKNPEKLDMYILHDKSNFNVVQKPISMIRLDAVQGEDRAKVILK